MPKIYCPKCDKEVKVKYPTYTTIKGRRVIRKRCPICKTTICKSITQHRKDTPTDIRELQLVANPTKAGILIRYKGVDIFLFAGSYEGMDEFIKELGRRWRALKRKQPEIVKEGLVREAESILLGGKE